MIRSYRVRAILALLFLVGFYAVALALSLGLLSIAYAEMSSGGRMHARLVMFCVVAAGVILWSLVPRFEKWKEPGPRVERADQPRLFALIEEIAVRMGLAMPSEVYLVPEVNAWVAQRGGFLGLGSRRVMGIGVPLLAVQSVGQLRSVLAHEFGHYAGGDTKLSGVIYATRSAMIRTFQNLRAAEQGSAFLGLLRLPFEWMLGAYLRITQAIGRRQEIFADEWSVRLAGREAAGSALASIGPAAHGFELFVEQELKPLLAAGLQPDNVFEGYRRYRTSSGWRGILPAVERAVREESPDPLDSHPPLAERLSAIAAVDAPDVPDDPSPAYGLLSDPGKVEEAFSRRFRVPDVPVIPWDRAAEGWAKLHRDLAVRAEARHGVTAGSIAVLACAGEPRRAFVESVDPRFRGDRGADRAEREAASAARFLSSTLGTLLAACGWTWSTGPGEPVLLVREDDPVDPLVVVQGVVDGKTDPAAFAVMLAGWGLSPEARVEPSPDEARDARRRRATIEVSQEKNATRVSLGLREAVFPNCCAVCLGPPDATRLVTLQESKLVGEGASIELPLGACNDHRLEVHKAMGLKKVDVKTGQALLEVRSERYAELIESVNA